MFHERLYLELRLPFPDVSLSGQATSTEQRLGVSFPASVKEWVARADAVKIASSQDNFLRLDDFRIAEAINGKFLTIMLENQGCCEWGVLLNGSDDPPVYVNNRDDRGWEKVCELFSDLIFVQPWDWPNNLPFGAYADASDITKEHLSHLKSVLPKLIPTTLGWYSEPHPICHRFEDEGFHLRLERFDYGFTHFWIHAESGNDLLRVLDIVKDMGDFSERVSGQNDESDKFLREAGFPRFLIS